MSLDKTNYTSQSGYTNIEPESQNYYFNQEQYLPLKSASDIGNYIVSNIIDPIMGESKYVGQSVSNVYNKKLREILRNSDLWIPGFTIPRSSGSNAENYKLWEKAGDAYLEAAVSDLVQKSNAQNIDHDSFHQIQVTYKSNDVIGAWAEELGMLDIVRSLYYIQTGEFLPYSMWSTTKRGTKGGIKGDIFEAFLGVMYRIGENKGMGTGFFIVKGFVMGMINYKGHDLTKVPEKDPVSWVKETLETVRKYQDFQYKSENTSRGVIYKIYITKDVAQAINYEYDISNPFSEGFDRKSQNIAKRKAYENMRDYLKQRGFDLNNRPFKYNERGEFDEALNKALNLGFTNLSLERHDNTKSQIELALYGYKNDTGEWYQLETSDKRRSYKKARSNVLTKFLEEY